MTWTFIVSYAVVPDSEVSVRIQYDSAGAAAADGMVTDCDSFSVVVTPLPPSHIFQLPVCAGRPVFVVMAPALPVQLTTPDSKPGLSSRLPLGGGVVPQVSVPTGAEIAAKDATMPAHCADPTPYRSLAALTAPVRASA